MNRRRHQSGKGSSDKRPDSIEPVGESPSPPPVTLPGMAELGSAGGGSMGGAARVGFAAKVGGVAKLIGGVLMIAGASLGVGWSAWHYALSSPRFSVREVQWQGLQVLKKPELLAVAGVEMGMNTFSIELQRSQQALANHRWVREAKVTRELPAVLRIEVSEHEALALLVLDKQLHLVSAEGEVFSARQAGDPYDLPVVTGLTAEDFARDRERATEHLRRALTLLAQYSRHAMAKIWYPEEVHLAPDRRVSLVVGREGVMLRLGREGPAGWDTKLTQAGQVLHTLHRRDQLPRVVFLDNDAHPERVVARVR